MSDVQTVSMIGLGNMGSALARAIAKAGHDLTVWNRSGEKCRPLADEGASVALSVGEAVSRSDVIVVCVRGYDVATALFDNPATFSTGWPRRAMQPERKLTHSSACLRNLHRLAAEKCREEVALFPG